MTASRPVDDSPPTAIWPVGADIGRAYAAVSGDRNPIHCRGSGARLFGFPGPIAHGMWTKAHALAALEGELGETYAVEVALRAPDPAAVHGDVHREAAATGFELDVRGRSATQLSGPVTARRETRRAGLRVGRRECVRLACGRPVRRRSRSSAATGRSGPSRRAAVPLGAVPLRPGRTGRGAEAVAAADRFLGRSRCRTRGRSLATRAVATERAHGVAAVVGHERRDAGAEEAAEDQRGPARNRRDRGHVHHERRHPPGPRPARCRGVPDRHLARRRHPARGGAHAPGGSPDGVHRPSAAGVGRSGLSGRSGALGRTGGASPRSAGRAGRQPGSVCASGPSRASRCGSNGRASTGPGSACRSWRAGRCRIGCRSPSPIAELEPPICGGPMRITC